MFQVKKLDVHLNAFADVKIKDAFGDVLLGTPSKCILQFFGGCFWKVSSKASPKAAPKASPKAVNVWSKIPVPNDRLRQLDENQLLEYNKNKYKRGYNLVVECHASDLIARVRFPLPAPKSP